MKEGAIITSRRPCATDRPAGSANLRHHLAAEAAKFQLKKGEH